MSDNNICPKCGCPVPVHFWHCPDHPAAVNIMQAEIARLKAAIAHMQVELSNAMAERDEARAEKLKTMHLMFHFQQERDEARKWALEFREIGRRWKAAYENVWKNNHITPKER